MQMLTRMCLNTEIKALNATMTIYEWAKEWCHRRNASVTWCTNDWKNDRVKIANFVNEVQHLMLSRLVTWVIELMGMSMRHISSSQSWTGMAMNWEQYHEELLTFSNWFCWSITFWYSRNRFRSNKIKLRIWFYVFTVVNLFESGVR